MENGKIQHKSVSFMFPECHLKLRNHAELTFCKDIYLIFSSFLHFLVSTLSSELNQIQHPGTSGSSPAAAALNSLLPTKLPPTVPR